MEWPDQDPLALAGNPTPVAGPTICRQRYAGRNLNSPLIKSGRLILWFPDLQGDSPMAMGRQKDGQGDPMVSWSEMPRSPGHVFYDRLQSVLIEAASTPLPGPFRPRVVESSVIGRLLRPVLPAPVPGHLELAGQDRAGTACPAVTGLS